MEKEQKEGEVVRRREWNKSGSKKRFRVCEGDRSTDMSGSGHESSRRSRSRRNGKNRSESQSSSRRRRNIRETEADRIW